MNILAVDSDIGALSNLEKTLLSVYKGAKVLAFSDPLMAIKYGSLYAVDIIYTEIKLPHLDGVTLARMFKKRYPGMCIYLISNAFSEGIPVWEFSGLLLKPVDGVQVLKS